MKNALATELKACYWVTLMLILTVIDSYKKKGRLNPENLKLEHMSDLTVKSDCAWVKISMHPAGKPSYRMIDMKPIKIDFFFFFWS